MKTSTDRILTTHVGSLPRPDGFLKLLLAREAGEPVDGATFERACAEAVDDTVARQKEAGVDVVSDGEMSKPSYSTYMKDRLTGFGGFAARGHAAKDLLEFREYARRLVEIGGTERRVAGPACNGPVAVKDRAALERDLANFRRACDRAAPVDAFLTSASPGVASVFLQNQYYPSEDAYLEALSDAMRDEYEAVANAGFVLQIDCPDLAMGRHLAFKELDLPAFRKRAEKHVAVLNHATRNIAPERMRMHLCWGNYQGPHHHDVPLADILDIVLTARPQGISVEGANPRHEHEWEVFDRVKLPDDKVLIPGVIDSVSNFIEHPRLVCQRIVRYAERVGRERVIAGADCGFATFAGHPAVHPSIAWAKLATLAEGAKLASDELW